MRRCILLVSPLIALLAVDVAMAQNSPWTVRASQAFAHESNVFHLDDGVALPVGVSRSDNRSTTELLGGLDLPVGRQRLYATALLRSVQFQENDQLDSEGFAVNLGVDWETVGRLSGSVDLRADRRLARFDTDTELANRLTRNVETSQQARATVRVGVVTAVTGEAGVEYRRVNYSAAAFESRENHQSTATMGLRYRPSGAATYGVGLRHVRGKYPHFGVSNGQVLADAFTQDGVDLTLSVDPTGASQLYARATFGRTSYDQATRRDFSGVSGVFVWRYQPGARLKLNTRLARDSGQDSYFGEAASPDGFTDFSRTTTSLRLRADYELSAKIMLTATVAMSERDLVRTRASSLATPADATGSDRTALLSLGASWAPTRALTIGCDLSQERRRAHGDLSRPYRAVGTACRVEMSLH